MRASNFTKVLVLALLSASCFASDFDTQLTEAERLRAKAAEAGYEWIETGKLLEQAREEAANDNLDEAIALVEKARFQALAAITQAEHEAEAWQKRVLQ